MEVIVDSASHWQIVIITLAMVAIIAYARKVEKSIFPGALIILNLALLMYHTFVLNSLPQTLTAEISHIYLCLAMDFLWLLISFLGYLWIDDIVAIKFHKKSYDNSLSWFWDKL